jgi:anhydro-N-acetylmuramic acid kinase
MTDSTRLVVGAMSGTSADGVDVAITRIDGRGLGMGAQLIRHHHRPYDAALRRAIFALRSASALLALAELARLARDISLAYAAAVNEALLAANLKSDAIAAVAAHGQTLYHAPPDTLQWLDPALLAAETGCPVVSDFRRADCAAGGQGAPLVPFADYVLFRHPTRDRVLLNLGGIANITYVPADGFVEQVVAFDVGPANCVSDALMRRHDPNGPGIDIDGRRALRGTVRRHILDRLREVPFLARRPPKSTDGPEMIAAWEQAVRAVDATGAPLEDLLATACRWTAECVNAAMVACEFLPEELIVSGGGTRNPAIMRHLRETCDPNIPITSATELGVPSDAKEAIAFALLAAATLDNVPSNIPTCTGARRHAVLGSITPRP